VLTLRVPLLVTAVGGRYGPYVLLLRVSWGCAWCHMGQQRMLQGTIYPNILYSPV